MKVQKIIPNNKAEKALLSGDESLIKVYRSELRKLEIALVKFWRGEMSLQKVSRYLSREITTAFAAREAVIAENLKRSAGVSYEDILYQSERLIRKASGGKKEKELLLQLRKHISKQSYTIDAPGYENAMRKQLTSEIDNVKKILTTNITQGKSQVQKLANEAMEKGLRKSVNILHTSGQYMINSAAKMAIESTMVEDLRRGYGVHSEKPVTVWWHGQAQDPRKNPRTAHMRMQGGAPDQNGFYWTETGNAARFPKTFNDLSENWGCRCFLTTRMSNVITKVLTAYGHITIPQGSYLLWLAA